MPKKLLDKEINQLKYVKTSGFLDTKDQDKIKWIICLYLQEMRQKNNISGDAGHFFKNRNWFNRL